MSLYQVTRAIHGVPLGTILEIEGQPHPALRANLAPAPKGATATPSEDEDASLPSAPGLPAAPSKVGKQQ